MGFPGAPECGGKYLSILEGDAVVEWYHGKLDRASVGPSALAGVRSSFWRVVDIDHACMLQ